MIFLVSNYDFNNLFVGLKNKQTSNISIKHLRNNMTSSIPWLSCKHKLIILLVTRYCILAWVLTVTMISFLCIVVAIIYILLHQKSWHVGTILSSRTFLRHVRYNNDRGSQTLKTYITTIRYFNGKWANNEDETLKKEDINDANRKDRNVIISLFLFVLLRLLSNNHLRLS